MTNSYDSVLNPARKLFRHTLEGEEFLGGNKRFLASHYLSEYFNAAEKVNPSLALTALQQANCDEYLSRSAECETATELKNLIRNSAMTKAEINFDSRYKALKNEFSILCIQTKIREKPIKHTPKQARSDSQ